MDRDTGDRIVAALDRLSDSFADVSDDAEPNVSDALMMIARALQNLGNANATTHLGGLEALGLVFKEGLESIASAIDSGSGGDSISGGLDDIAVAIRDHAAAVDRLTTMLERRG